MSAKSRTLSFASTILLTALSPTRATHAQDIRKSERTYVLSAVNERPLPYHDTTVAFIDPRATWSIVRGSLRIGDRSAVLELTRHEHFLDSWPCDALEAMRSDERKQAASGRRVASGALRRASTDSADRSCDKLREERDTLRLRVLHPTPGVDVLVRTMKQDFAKWPYPEGGRVVGDTARLTQWTVSGKETRTGHERAQELRLLFVRQPVR